MGNGRVQTGKNQHQKTGYAAPRLDEIGGNRGLPGKIIGPGPFVQVELRAAIGKSRLFLVPQEEQVVLLCERRFQNGSHGGFDNGCGNLFACNDGCFDGQGGNAMRWNRFGRAQKGHGRNGLCGNPAMGLAHGGNKGYGQDAVGAFLQQLAEHRGLRRGDEKGGVEFPVKAIDGLLESIVSLLVIHQWVVVEDLAAQNVGPALPGSQVDALALQIGEGRYPRPIFDYPV